MDDERLLTLKEAAALCELSLPHLQLLAKKGRLRARKLGRDWFTTRAAVDAYLTDPHLRSKDPYKNKRS